MGDPTVVSETEWPSVSQSFPAYWYKFCNEVRR